ncbi:MAG: hypothetical protein U9N73_02330 [Candidatus Auribacterota bacterium]|nr:hypothetical protein [Candidatus Auribacterota bacterium]
MKKVMAILVLIGAMTLVSQAGAAPSFTGTPGYMVRPIVTIPGDSSTWTSGIQSIDGDENGSVYLFGQNQYILKKEPGSSATVLYDYGSSVFGSFVKLQGETLYFGESTTGSIKSIPAAGGTADNLFTLANSYDCAFNSQSMMALSANPSWSGNMLYVWWHGMTDPQVIANVGDNSGPIAFDNNDNLYYGRSTTYPPGPEDIVYFTAAQVANAISTGTPLTSSDWAVYAAGVNAPGGMTFDQNAPVPDLFSTSSGLGTLSRITAAATRQMGTGTYPSSPRFLGAGSLRSFLNSECALVVNCTDYNNSYDSTIYAIRSCPQNFIIGSGDYSITGASDIAVFRPDSGLWAIRDVTRTYFGAEDDLPVAGDYDGDGTSDPSIYRPDSGLWATRDITRVYFGSDQDIPLPRDYDADGTADPAIFRPTSGLWAIRGVTRAYFGADGDFPVPDYTGDGALVIFRPSTGLWAVRDLTRFYFGASGDLPVPGDYDGDGSTDAGVYRPASGLWAIRGVTRIYFGSGEDWDVPVPLDYQGSGTTALAIYRPSAGLWAIRGVTRVYFGSEGDFPATR